MQSMKDNLFSDDEIEQAIIKEKERTGWTLANLQVYISFRQWICMENIAASVEEATLEEKAKAIQELGIRPTDVQMEALASVVDWLEITSFFDPTTDKASRFAAGQLKQAFNL